LPGRADPAPPNPALEFFGVESHARRLGSLAADGAALVSFILSFANPILFGASSTAGSMAGRRLLLVFSPQSLYVRAKPLIGSFLWIGLTPLC